MLSFKFFTMSAGDLCDLPNGNGIVANYNCFRIPSSPMRIKENVPLKTVNKGLVLTHPNATLFLSSVWSYRMKDNEGRTHVSEFMTIKTNSPLYLTRSFLTTFCSKSIHFMLTLTFKGIQKSLLIWGFNRFRSGYFIAFQKLFDLHSMVFKQDTTFGYCGLQILIWATKAIWREATWKVTGRYLKHEKYSAS